MKVLLILCIMLAPGINALAQKKDCNVTVTKDSFTDKRRIATIGNRIIEKLYLAEAMLNHKNREGWHVTLLFLQTEEGDLQICIRHETAGIAASVNRMDFKFADGTILTFDKPIRGEYVLGTVLVFPHQPTYFALSAEQLTKFSKLLVVRARVKFDDFPNDPEVEKEIKSLRAEKVKAEAACFAEHVKRGP
jgi:hypothetical protein